MGERADSTGDLADSNVFGRSIEAYLIPTTLVVPDRELQAKNIRLGVDAVREASLVIVPAVAVDRSGVRLGRGGGSYDRVLARLDRVTLTVALLYDGELVESVPAEPHDRAVQAAITPSGGLSPSRVAAR